jgi:hypothetical protein
VVAGLGIGLMWATKETSVITLATMAVALVAAWLSNRRRLESTLQRVPDMGQAKAWTPTLRHAALALLAVFIVWLVLFSSFFTNFSGLPDSIRTFFPWLKRAGGHSPHIHPWSFYLERLAWFHPAKSPVWSEGLILVLAAVGAGVSWFGKKSPLHRFLVIYAIALTAAYSMIPYKTPWCLLSFFHGMILLAGIGAAALVEFCRASAARVIVVAVLVVATAQLVWQSWQASFIFFADRKNPYVYSQTVPDVLNLVQKTEALAKVSLRKATKRWSRSSRRTVTTDPCRGICAGLTTLVGTTRCRPIPLRQSLSFHPDWMRGWTRNWTRNG